MKIIVCGAGQVGLQIAKQLSDERMDVIVVDKSSELIEKIVDELDVSAICGYASYPNVLERAGAHDADMIIAATLSDEVNMVTCQIAHSIFSVPRKIARIRSNFYLEENYSSFYRSDHLPIDEIISPEKEIAEGLLKRLEVPAAFEATEFLDGAAVLIGLKLREECAVLSTPLRQLSELFSTLNAIVVGIKRGNTLFVPSPEDELFPNDSIYVFSDKKDINRTIEIFDKKNFYGKSIVIVGMGSIGQNVAKILESRRKEGINVKVIEKSKERAIAAADILEKTVVLNGDGLDTETLKEANVSLADFFVALTDDDKTNLIACSKAKSFGSKFTMSLVNDPSLDNMISLMGIDAFINPKSITVSSILRHVRHGMVRSVYSLGNGEAEVLEYRVLDSSPVAGKTLKEVEWPKDALVGLLKKDSEVLVPRSNTKFEQGDLLTVFCLRDDINKVENLFQVGVDFF
ncbi:Trk system potassium transporter TrkA [Paracoccaceae bacterium]|nr:Trk system potassium transporter TrkA [Paracoccaceae bacterium]